jgi:CheY-like chemotaxis protein
MHTVLVVEDEWLVRMEMTAAFEDEGCTVLEGASAEDAIGILRASRLGGPGIGLLVTDIRLGGPLTGWDVAAEARALDPAIAVIYVSANPPAPGRDVKASVFLDKPALASQVIREARRILGHD